MDTDKLFWIPYCGMALRVYGFQGGWCLKEYCQYTHRPLPDSKMWHINRTCLNLINHHPFTGLTWEEWIAIRDRAPCARMVDFTAKALRKKIKAGRQMCRDIDDYSNKELLRELVERKISIADVLNTAYKGDIPTELTGPIFQWLQTKPLDKIDLDNWKAGKGAA